MRFEVDRTASNSNELGRRNKSDANPMKYEEWSKSLELDQTLTPNFAASDYGRTEVKIFEQK